MKLKKHHRPSAGLKLNPLFRVTFMLVLIFISLPSIAQIQYVDINPDTTIVKGGSYTLDLNNDGLADFQLSVNNDTLFHSDEIRCLYDNCFVSHYVIEGCYMTAALDLNDSVKNGTFSYQFKPDFYTLYFGGLSYCMHSGSFGGQTDKYIGLKLVRNGIDYYGWLRIDVAADGSWIKLKDYAYAESGILAGQTIMNIGRRTIESQLSIFATESELAIKPNTNLKINNACLFNVLFQNRELPLNDNQVKITKSSLQRGLYFVRLNTSQGSCTIKVLIN